MLVDQGPRPAPNQRDTLVTVAPGTSPSIESATLTRINTTAPHLLIDTLGLKMNNGGAKIENIDEEHYKALLQKTAEAQEIPLGGHSRSLVKM